MVESYKSSACSLDKLFGYFAIQLETCISCREIIASNKLKYVLNIVRILFLCSLLFIII
jgi:hypothetical protein